MPMSPVPGVPLRVVPFQVSQPLPSVAGSGEMEKLGVGLPVAVGV